MVLAFNIALSTILGEQLESGSEQYIVLDKKVDAIVNEMIKKTHVLLSNLDNSLGSVYKTAIKIGELVKEK